MQRFVQVDAFTDRPFAGNPAAVCVLVDPAPDDWMQLVAREMNLSETAFLHPVDGGYRLRWFTPSVEVDLCGHATLASAHVLWEDRHVPAEQEARFATNSGILTCQRDGDWIRMDFPSEPAVERYDQDAVASALGAPVRGAWRNRFDILVELENARAVRELSPDLARVGRLPARGVIVTARSDDPAFDFESRFFGPAAGVPEDPVTGSAHCFLAPFWGERLGRVEMTGFQASARCGVVKVEVAGDRVILRGQAVTVARGEILAMPVD
jgi:predicted PhzF superfamily epimerase YddE/YHI9